jgi:Leucine-rich repeat (LRR) protein
MLFSAISFLFLFFVNYVFGAEIPCTYDVNIATHCMVPYQQGLLNVQVTAENEPITVTTTGNPPNGLAHYKSIYFQNPHVLKYIPTNMFAQLPNLERFQAQSVQFTTMTEDAFINCNNLKEIHLYSNSFSTITARFAKTCLNVKKIDFGRNGLTTFDKDALQGLMNLEWLQLQYNQISFLDPMTFIHTPNLKQFMINDNKLTSIDPNLFAPMSPSEIHLYSNQITAMPALSFASSANLDKLYFENNKISAVSRQFFLNYIQTGKPYTIAFDGNICISRTFNDPNEPGLIDYADLQDCFSNFDPSWTTVTISTSTSTITTPIPTDSCDSHRDCRYYLDHDQVYVCVLENVDLILSSIGGTHEKIGMKAYSDFDVEAVYFKKSTLSKIPKIIFEKFQNLKFLSVVKTKMTIINENTFELCGNLKTLDARDNSISRITGKSLMQCHFLETILMTGNLELEEIESEIFMMDPNLKHIVLNRRG